MSRSITALLFCQLIAPSPGVQGQAADQPQPLTMDAEWASSFHWRSVGPAAAGGRILRIAVVESDPKVWYVSTASGGVWKTINNGVTFEGLFQHENTISIGDLAVSRSNPNILWVGTGEHNPRNSVSWGDGVYKSTDAEEVALTIKDPEGSVLRSLPDSTMSEIPTSPGLHRVIWDLRRDLTEEEQAAAEEARESGERGRGPSRPMVGPGAYEVVLSVGGESMAKRLLVLPDPGNR